MLFDHEYKKELRKHFPILKPAKVKKFILSNLIIGLVVTLLLIVSWTILSSSAEAFEIDMDKIAMIESSGCKHKYGNFEHARGCWQITGGALADWNQDHPHEQYDIEQMLDDETCLKVAKWYYNVKIPAYFRAYKINDTVLHRLAAYNWGIGRVVKWYRNGASFESLPVVTQKYYAKYTKN